ncbi:MAG: BatA domain-containing protein [Phycisphaerales bacterium]|nr:MAG: BatA domain-containing protein [Phycisphaerales bacterium]
MTFASWIFLLGGLAAAGPVIAHLLAKPRYRRLPFTMLRFLRAGQIESQSRRKLRDLLILLLRCAIIVLIAVLFARPALHVTPKATETRDIYCLGLDNSMSMAYSDGSDTYFERMVLSAADYVRRAESGGLFNICALASGDWVQGLSQQRALAELKRLRIVPGSANVSDFLSTLSTAVRKKRPGDVISVFVASDFTPKTLDQFGHIAESIAVGAIEYRAVASEERADNAAVVNARAVGVDGGKLTLDVTVANYGQVEQKRRLTAQVESQKSPPVDVSLAPGQRGIHQAQIDLGVSEERGSILPVELKLSAADGLEADDTFYVAVSIPQRKNTNVILAGGGGEEMFLLETALDVLSRTSSYDTLRLKHVLISELDRSQLQWADMVICSAISDQLGRAAAGLANFVMGGGKVIFFATDRFSQTAVDRLWRQGILPALPTECVRERVYLEPRPCVSQPLDVDDSAARSLANYRIDKIALTGYLRCEQHPDSEVLWRLANGFGFVYLKRQANGTSLFVNTSADDSLGPVTKSNAVVALCRYLLGKTSRLSQYGFACDEPVQLPFPGAGSEPGRNRQLWVQTCDGRRRRAALAGSSLSIPDPAGIGWVRTIGETTTYAGVNLPDGETNMTRPNELRVANVMSEVFSVDEASSPALADVLGEQSKRPLWRILAWVLLILLLAEPAIASRLRR